MMTEQEQIDRLKRLVIAQGMELQHLKNCLATFVEALQYPPMTPTCGDCGAVMYDGAMCAKPASHCPMGVGVLEAE